MDHDGTLQPLCWGEQVPELDGYVIKVVIDGMNGNDGNLYKLALSIKQNENVSVEGANAFAYEYSVRLQSEARAVAHVYPFADNMVASFNIRTFDFDTDGQIKLYSSVKNGHLVKVSNDNEWSVSKHKVQDEERNKCLDLQIVKKAITKRHCVLCNQRVRSTGSVFAAPIGGVPVINTKSA